MALLFPGIFYVAPYILKTLRPVFAFYPKWRHLPLDPCGPRSASGAWPPVQASVKHFAKSDLFCAFFST